MQKVVVVLKDGSKTSLENWQKLYNLEVGSKKIGKYFSLDEPRFASDLKAYGELVVNEQLIRLLDAFREKVNLPISLNSFNRSEAHQAELRAQGFKAAINSPHVAKMAADIDTVNATQTRNWAKTIQEVAKQKGIKVRIGFEQYLSVGQTFIHVDVCPEFYAKGKPFSAQAHPTQWEFELMW